MEDIHRRRLSGNTRIPSVEVDLITKRMVQSVIAGTETGEDWWLLEPTWDSHSVRPGAPSSPPLLVRLPNTSETIRSSRALESSRLQGPH